MGNSSINNKYALPEFHKWRFNGEWYTPIGRARGVDKNKQFILKAAAKYGSEERGEKVAGAILARIRAKHEAVELSDDEIDSLLEDYDDEEQTIPRFVGKKISCFHDDDEWDEQHEITETTRDSSTNTIILWCNTSTTLITSNSVYVNSLANTYTITANSTGFSNTDDTIIIASANSKFTVNDKVYYQVPSGNTPISPLTSNTYYYVSFANATTIKLANTSGGANIDITDARTTNPGETHILSLSQFIADYSTGQYIRVGENSNTTIRRITSVNSTVITVSHAFSNTINTANNYLVNTAFSVDSITKRESLGSVIYTNLNSAEVTYSNVVPVSSKFILGETVVLVDGANTSQGANGTVSFYDEDNIILSDVQGTISANLYLYGLSSQTKAYIDSNDSYPNITVDTVEGGFYSGVNITVRYANGVPTANANIVTKYSSPNELTEYIISPKVNIFASLYVIKL